MKMWVSVTSAGEVGNIIKKEHLGIESYTEKLVNMFNAIVSRDAQSPHGKFYFVAKRLQERFAQIKEGTQRTDTSDARDDQRRSETKPSNKRPRQTSVNQTPLHLLSEVAMGSSSSTPSTNQTQQSTMPPPMPQGWYNPGVGAGAHQPDMMGLPPGGFDPNFDFTQFDLSMGSDADLSALFIPDSMLWNFGPDAQMSGYNQGAAF
jgi:hypothetical protein